jgi:hypothetical protein
VIEIERALLRGSQKLSVLLTQEVAIAECWLNFAMWASNDVSSNKSIAYTLTGIGTSTHSSVHSTCFATHKNGYIAATDELTANQSHFGSLGHGISRFNCGHEAASFDHAEGDAHGFVSHCLPEVIDGMFAMDNAPTTVLPSSKFDQKGDHHK